jgi:hypothetical protein
MGIAALNPSYGQPTIIGTAGHCTCRMDWRFLATCLLEMHHDERSISGHSGDGCLQSLNPTGGVRSEPSPFQVHAFERAAAPQGRVSCPAQRRTRCRRNNLPNTGFATLGHDALARHGTRAALMAPSQGAGAVPLSLLIAGRGEMARRGGFSGRHAKTAITRPSTCISARRMG